MTVAHASLIAIIIVLILYIIELVPIEVVAVGSCAGLVVFGIADAKTVWNGFASDTLLVVAGMIAVGIAVIETGAAKALGLILVKKFDGKYKICALFLVFITLLFSGFMNNSAAVATFLPALAGVIAASDGLMNEKHWFLPLAAAASAGGMLTLIGTTAQMIGQDLMVENGLAPFGFFEFAWIGVPVAISFVLYLLLFGERLGNRIWGSEIEGHTEYMRSLTAVEGKVSFTQKEKRKQILSVVILIAAIIAMVVQERVSNGTVAMIAAMACIVTGCITPKKLYHDFDWTTILVLAGGLGFGYGVHQAGGTFLVAQGIAALFGGAPSPMQIFVLFTIVSAVLTLFMSNTAVAAMMCPVAIAFTSMVDFNIAPVIMGICMGSNCAFSTPIATPCMTMVLGPGEYKFRDYARWCLPFNVVCLVIILIVTPLVWPL